MSEEKLNTEKAQTDNKLTTNKLAFLLVALASIGLIVASRFWPTDIPNFKPVAAVALFAGFFFHRRWQAISVALIGMVISDLVLGTYSIWMALFVYAALIIPVFFGSALKRVTVGWNLAFVTRFISSVLAGSMVFFLISNGAFWMFSGIYSYDVSGFVQCLVNGIPFFKFTFAGDAMFAVAIFGTYGLASEFVRVPHCVAE